MKVEIDAKEFDQLLSDLEKRTREIYLSVWEAQYNISKFEHSFDSLLKLKKSAEIRSALEVNMIVEMHGYKYIVDSFDDKIAKLRLRGAQDLSKRPAWEPGQIVEAELHEIKIP